MDRVPDYRTPEWRGWIEHGLMWGDTGIDAAMEWAYDTGIAAQSDYVRLNSRIWRAMGRADMVIKRLERATRQ